MSRSEKLKIFVSYSRSDMETADQLADFLEANDFDVLIDRRNLPYGEEWQPELANFIASCDTVVWLVSPKSIASSWCLWELGEVARQGKRLVPLRLADIDPSTLPEALGKIHLLPAVGVFSLEGHGEDLVTALNTDRAWIRDATRLSDRTREWGARNSSSGLLLRGDALKAAEQWVSTRPAAAPTPTSAVLDFILASRQAASRRQRYWTFGLVGITLSALGLSALAYVQRQAAIVERNNALISQSLSLAEKGRGALKAGDTQLAARLALYALDGGPDERPVVPEANDLLARALYQHKGATRFAIGKGKIVDAVFSKNTQRLAAIISGGVSNTLKIFDTTTSRELYSVDAPGGGQFLNLSMSESGKYVGLRSWRGFGQHRRVGRDMNLARSRILKDVLLVVDAVSGKAVWSNQFNSDKAPRWLGFDPTPSDNEKLILVSNGATFVLRADGRKKPNFIISQHKTNILIDRVLTATTDEAGRSLSILHCTNQLYVLTQKFATRSTASSASSSQPVNIKVHDNCGDKHPVNVLYRQGQDFVLTFKSKPGLFGILDGKPFNYAPDAFKETVVDFTLGASQLNFMTQSGKLCQLARDRVQDQTVSHTCTTKDWGEGAQIASACCGGAKALRESETGEMDITNVVSQRIVPVAIGNRKQDEIKTFHSTDAVIWSSRTGLFVSQETGTAAYPTRTTIRLRGSPTTFDVGTSEILIGYENGLIEKRDLSGETVIWSFSGPPKKEASLVTMDRAAKRVAVGFKNSPHIHLLDFESGKLIGTFDISTKNRKHRPSVFKFSPDGATLYARARAPYLFLLNTNDMSLKQKLRVPKEHEDPIRQFYGFQRARFLSDGKRLLTSTAGDGYVVRLPVYLWDLEKGKPVHAFPHRLGIYGFDLDASESRLLTYSRDRVARIWDLASGKLVRELRGHTAGIFSAYFIEQDRQIVTFSNDGTFRRWSAADGTLINAGQLGESQPIVFPSASKRSFGTMIGPGGKKGVGLVTPFGNNAMLQVSGVKLAGGLISSPAIQFSADEKTMFILDKRGRIIVQDLLGRGKEIVEAARTILRLEDEILTKSERVENNIRN